MSYTWKRQWAAQSRICVLWTINEGDRKKKEWLCRCVVLHKTPGPGHHSQCDFVLLQLQHGDERGVVHSHCGGSIHCHNLITAPGGNHRAFMLRGMKRCWRRVPAVWRSNWASLTWGVRQSAQVYRAQWFWWRTAAGRGSPRSRRRYWSPSSRCWSSAGRCPGTSAWDWDEQRQSQHPNDLNALEVEEQNSGSTSVVPASESTGGSSWMRRLVGHPKCPVRPCWQPRRPPLSPLRASGWHGAPPGTEPSESSAQKRPRCRSTGSDRRRWCSAERRLRTDRHFI